jgi:hypothetical protein
MPRDVTMDERPNRKGLRHSRGHRDCHLSKWVYGNYSDGRSHAAIYIGQDAVGLRVTINGPAKPFMNGSFAFKAVPSHREMMATRSVLLRIARYSRPLDFCRVAYERRQTSRLIRKLCRHRRRISRSLDLATHGRLEERMGSDRSVPFGIRPHCPFPMMGITFSNCLFFDELACDHGSRRVRFAMPWIKSNFTRRFRSLARGSGKEGRPSEARWFVVACLQKSVGNEQEGSLSR